jgi:glucosamine-6-phosphate deaminase
VAHVVHRYADEKSLADAAATRVAGFVRRHPLAVLGLPTGRTPVALYEVLAAMVAAGRVDFSRVTTFNLDEFVGLDAADPRSYCAFMQAHFFGPARIAPSQVRFLDGTAADLDAECARYERAIEAAGGIDLMILGIGVNGHIGFNEPAPALRARTHVAALHEETRAANATLFGGDPDAVPSLGLSMGMATILGAREIILLATGSEKAAAVRRALDGAVCPEVPASFLQLHPRVAWLMDEAAAVALTRETPVIGG